MSTGGGLVKNLSLARFTYLPTYLLTGTFLPTYLKVFQHVTRVYIVRKIPAVRQDAVIADTSTPVIIDTNDPFAIAYIVVPPSLRKSVTNPKPLYPPLPHDTHSFSQRARCSSAVAADNTEQTL